MSDLIQRLNRHALPDTHDEREVMHAPLLREAAAEIERLRGERDVFRAVLEGMEYRMLGKIGSLPVIHARTLGAAAKQECLNLIARAESAERQRDEAIADAERWRWIKAQPDYMVSGPIQEMWRKVFGEERRYPTPDEWDAAIDAAITDDSARRLLNQKEGTHE